MMQKHGCYIYMGPSGFSVRPLNSDVLHSSYMFFLLPLSFGFLSRAPHDGKYVQPEKQLPLALLLARSCFFCRVWHGSGAERGRSRRRRRSCAKRARNICVHVHCIQERIDPGVSDEYHLCAVHSRAITSDLANANVSPPKDPTIAS